jgi:hypothetical protein
VSGMTFTVKEREQVSSLTSSESRSVVSDLQSKYLQEIPDF